MWDSFRAGVAPQFLRAWKETASGPITLTPSGPPFPPGDIPTLPNSGTTESPTTGTVARATGFSVDFPYQFFYRITLSQPNLITHDQMYEIARSELPAWTGNYLTYPEHLFGSFLFAERFTHNGGA